MFGLLNTTQIYGIQSQSQEHEQHFQISFHPMSPPASATASSSSASSSAQQNIIAHSNSNPHPAKGHQRTSSSVSDSGGGVGGGGGNGTSGKFLSNLTSKSPTNFLEKFLKSDLLNTYDSLKNYRNSFPSNNSQSKRYSDPLNNGHVHHHPEGFVNSFNCLHGSYRHSFDGEFYEKTDVKHILKAQEEKEKQEEAELVASSLRHCSQKSSEMTIKCSKNLLAVEPEVQGPATLQNYQKIPESEHDLLVDSLLVASSGASSGEFNSSSDTTTQSSSGGGGGSAGGSSSFSSSSSNLYKRLSFGGIRNSQNSQKQEKNAQAQQQQQQQMDGVSTVSRFDQLIFLGIIANQQPSVMAKLDLGSSSISGQS